MFHAKGPWQIPDYGYLRRYLEKRQNMFFRQNIPFRMCLGASPSRIPQELDF